jgi:hypothetical protein
MTTPLSPAKAGRKPPAVTVEILPLLVPTIQTGWPQRFGVDEALQFRSVRRAQAGRFIEAARVRRRGIRHHDVKAVTQEKVGGPDQEVAG